MIMMEEKIPAANLKPIFFTINAPRGAATNDYNTNHSAAICMCAYTGQENYQNRLTYELSSPKLWTGQRHMSLDLVTIHDLGGHRLL